MTDQINKIIESLRRSLHDAPTKEVWDCIAAAIQHLEDALALAPETCDHQHNVQGREIVS